MQKKYITIYRSDFRFALLCAIIVGMIAGVAIVFISGALQ